MPFLDAQIKIINHLAISSLSKKFQIYLLNKENKELALYVQDGKNYYIRILTFWEGDFWVDCKDLSENTYIGLGDFFACIT